MYAIIILGGKMKIAQVQDLSKTLKPYSNEWVALSPKNNKVLSSGNDLSKVIETAHKKGEKKPVVTKVPKDYGNYVLGL
jgi:hypothetical protein